MRDISRFRLWQTLICVTAYLYRFGSKNISEDISTFKLPLGNNRLFVCPLDVLSISLVYVDLSKGFVVTMVQTSLVQQRGLEL